MCRNSHYTVTGKDGRYFVRRDGNFAFGPFPTKELADATRARIVAKNRSRTRACISCGDPFVSEGPHNRMCDPCRTNPYRAIHIAWGDAA